MSSPHSRCLVFTDLDGSLLDHHNYSYCDAIPMLNRLEHLGIPVIPATSKTRSEILQLREELGNGHPFIVENGAAVFIPRGYFAKQPAETCERDDYWVREFSAGRGTWLQLLESLDDEFAGEFDSFHRAGVEGIMRMTGLSHALAIEANRREYSEPVKWLGSAELKADFIAGLQAGGATVLQGGRFLSVAGDCDKGRALQWLREVYSNAGSPGDWYDLAIGDSGNDVAMLEAAQSALLVRSPVHDLPELSRQANVMTTTDFGPAGWAEGVARWLESLREINT